MPPLLLPLLRKKAEEKEKKEKRKERERKRNEIRAPVGRYVFARVRCTDIPSVQIYYVNYEREREDTGTAKRCAVS